MTGKAAGRLQGDDLIAEVLRNMEEGLFHIRRKTIVPAIYRLYLNPADFEPFRDIVPFISNEIRAALDERLKMWNGAKKSFPAAVASTVMERIGLAEASATSSEFVRAAESWVVDLLPDLDNKLKPGEIEVYSDLGSPQKPDYGGGSLTRRIFPRPADDAEAAAQHSSASSSPSSRQEGPDTSPTVQVLFSQQPSANGPADLASLNFPSSTHEDGTKPRALAYIRYADQHGNKTFEVTKNQMVIGRGGRSYWVDLRLETVPDVSREHCRIRRDADTGRFTIEDLSQFGTAVNGKPVSKDGATEIPYRATISLAGVIDLTWEAA